MGLGAAAMASLGGGNASANVAFDPSQPLRARKPHFAPKAKSVIYLHMTGSPPGLDLFDYKPELVKREGQNCPDEFLKGRRFAFTSGVPKLMGTPHKFAKHGQSGAWLSDALPELAKQADDIAFIKSMTTDQFNHAPAELLLYTGSAREGRPSMGSWVTYGLGSENQNLPGFVALISSGVQPNGGKNSFGNGFLPSVFQGVQCRSKGDPVLYVSNPKGMSRELRRKSLDALNDLNRIQAAELGSPETFTRIAQYEIFPRSRSTSSMLTTPSPARGVWPTTFCSRGGSWKRACALCISSIGAGISTALGLPPASAAGCAINARRWINPWPHSFATSSSAGSSTKRSSFGAASSAARPSAKAAPQKAKCSGAIIIRMCTRNGWPAAA